MYVYEDKKLTEGQYEILKPGYTAMAMLVANGTLPKGSVTTEYIKTCSIIHKAVFGGPNVNISSGPGIAFMFKQLLTKINEFNKSTASAASESTGPAEERSESGKKVNKDSSKGIKINTKATKVR